jgi:choline-sulfatase
MKNYFSALFLLAFCFLSFQKPIPAERPNIIVIFSDDHALQAIGAYGSPHISTPYIDRIANEGALFRNTFCTNSICAPSRAVLLTGKYNHLNGQMDNRGTTRMDTRQPSFAKYLQESGYATSWIGKWHINNTPQYFDFWRVLPDQGSYYNPDFINMDSSRSRIEGYAPEVITDQALNWLDSKRDKNKPFCLVIGHKSPHREWSPDIQDLHAFDDKPFAVPPTFFDDYKTRRAAAHQLMEIKDLRWAEDLKVGTDNLPFIKRMTTTQRTAWNAYYTAENAKLDTSKMTAKDIALWKYQRYMHDYMGCVRALDRNIGRILGYLDKMDLTKNTIVVYASDQGFYLGEHGWFDKRFMYEQSLRMPFMMRFPNRIKPQTVVNQMVVNIDFAPTLLQAVGIKPPADMQGRSVLPLATTKTPPKNWRTSMFYHYTEYPDAHRVMPHFGIRTERYKLIHFYNEKDSFWELFDLKTDPDELTNIYDQAKNKALIVGLKKELRALAVQYKDEIVVKLLDK